MKSISELNEYCTLYAKRIILGRMNNQTILVGFARE